MYFLIFLVRVYCIVRLYVFDSVLFVVLRQRHSGDLFIELFVDESTALAQRKGHPFSQGFGL